MVANYNHAYKREMLSNVISNLLKSSLGEDLIYYYQQGNRVPMVKTPNIPVFRCTANEFLCDSFMKLALFYAIHDHFMKVSC